MDPHGSAGPAPSPEARSGLPSEPPRTAGTVRAGKDPLASKPLRIRPHPSAGGQGSDRPPHEGARRKDPARRRGRDRPRGPRPARRRGPGARGVSAVVNAAPRSAAATRTSGPMILERRRRAAGRRGRDAPVERSARATPSASRRPALRGDRLVGVGGRQTVDRSLQPMDPARRPWTSVRGLRAEHLGVHARGTGPAVRWLRPSGAQPRARRTARPGRGARLRVPRGPGGAPVRHPRGPARPDRSGRRCRRAARRGLRPGPRDRRHGLDLGRSARPDPPAAASSDGDRPACLPRRPRARACPLERLGIPHVEVRSAGTSEDVAFLLAHERRAELIVAVGTHGNLREFLDKGRPGMSSTFLVRLRVGEILVDAKGVARLYPSRARVRDVAILVGAVLITFGLMLVGHAGCGSTLTRRSTTSWTCCRGSCDLLAIPRRLDRGGDPGVRARDPGGDIGRRRSVRPRPAAEL